VCSHAWLKLKFIDESDQHEKGRLLLCWNWIKHEHNTSVCVYVCARVCVCVCACVRL